MLPACKRNEAVIGSMLWPGVHNKAVKSLHQFLKIKSGSLCGKVGRLFCSFCKQVLYKLIVINSVSC